jgi:hypothetical protein
MDFDQKLHLTLFENNNNRPSLKDLKASGISFIIVGARALNVYSSRPRNTLDIDILYLTYFIIFSVI